MAARKKVVWIDVSTPLRNGMPYWPGDPPPHIGRIASLEQGDACNVTALSICAHLGTHVDAPLHYLRGAKPVDRMPLQVMIGPARVVQIRGRTAVGAAELRRQRIRRGERILFRTLNSSINWQARPFLPDYVALTIEAARFLAARRVAAVGIDYLSIGPPGPSGEETHRILLEAGVWILEGLDLRRAAPGRYHLVCLPLRIEGGDGAPARALLRPRR